MTPTVVAGLVIQTAKALVSMPIIVVLIPALQVVAYIAFTIPWLLFMIFFAASGDVYVAEERLTGDDASDDDSTLMIHVKQIRLHVKAAPQIFVPFSRVRVHWNVLTLAFVGRTSGSQMYSRKSSSSCFSVTSGPLSLSWPPVK
jgi:hypothetical protein